MATEKKGTVTAGTENGLILNREMYTSQKDGKNYFSYFVKGNVRGREVKVDFCAKDSGGYEVLDIIFDIKPTALLAMRKEEMKDDTGKLTRYVVYEAQNEDEDGNVFSYKIKPQRESDKALLQMLLFTKK